MRFGRMAVAVLVVWLASARAVLACPSCPTSRLVNALVCGQTFWIGLAATLTPLAAFSALVLALHRIGPAKRRPLDSHGREGGPSNQR